MHFKPISLASGTDHFIMSNKLTTRSFLFFNFFSDDIFPEVAGESIAHRKQRYENFKKCWESIKCEIEVPVMCVILWCLQYSRPCILLMC